MPDDFTKNHHGIKVNYPISDPRKNAQKINDYIAILNREKNKIKQQLIASDNSNNKTTIYAAMTQFKEKDE